MEAPAVAAVQVAGVPLEDLPPEVAWKRQLNAGMPELKEFQVGCWEALRLLPLGLRMWQHVRTERNAGRLPIIDPFNKKARSEASHGVPLGGLGCGGIGRGWRGEFNRWQLQPGYPDDACVPADQFSVFIRRAGRKSASGTVLFPGRPPGVGLYRGGSGIDSWHWNLEGKQSTYFALYPRAWTVYDSEPDPDLTLVCRQVSPVIPHNYKDSSLPAAVFNWTIVNKGSTAATVALLFSFKNSANSKAEDHSHEHVQTTFTNEDAAGVLLQHSTRKHRDPVSIAVSARRDEGVNVTSCPCFKVDSESQQSRSCALGGQSTSYSELRGGVPTARDVWQAMLSDLTLSSVQHCDLPGLGDQRGHAGAVAATCEVPAGGTAHVAFSLAWDCPIARFEKGTGYHRRYTKFYGTAGLGADHLASDALRLCPEWEAAIDAWQRSILMDSRLPTWYRSQLFNELYYLSAGGSVWTADNVRLESQHISTLQKLVDASARVVVEPLQKASDWVQNALLPGDDASRASVSNMHIAEHIGKTNLATIHSDSPASAICTQDTPQSIGHFLYLEGAEYLMWNTYDVHFYASFALLEHFPLLELSIQLDFAQATMEESEANQLQQKFLHFGNFNRHKVKGAVPHDLGFGDPWNRLNVYNIHDTSEWKDLNPKFVLQVYRDFAATNNRPFLEACWPAMHAAMQYMLKFDRDEDGLIENGGFPDQTYDTWVVRGKSAYCGGLWLAALQAASAAALELGQLQEAKQYADMLQCGKEAYERHLWNGEYYNYDERCKSVQADQLTGQLYAHACRLPGIVKDGSIGAMNGMKDGRVDDTCMQSREVWTGVTYMAAAAMIWEGLVQEGFATAHGIHAAGWGEYGYWFQTPEAWTLSGGYRCLSYMRALSIWAMHSALTLSQDTH
eukprot:jgi/Chlat1/281/Chrsp1S03057